LYYLQYVTRLIFLPKLILAKERLKKKIEPIQISSIISYGSNCK